jgi:hypothetical protein
MNHMAAVCTHYPDAVRFLGAAISAVVWLVLVATLSPPAEASGVKAIWGPVRRDGVSQFPIYRDLGVGIYETAIDWSSAAPTRPRHPRDPRDPAYRWPPAIADAVSEARAYNMRVLTMIIRAPRWANGNHRSNWAPLRPADYADFAVAASRRYPSVHLWMVWGEPSRFDNFAPLAPAPFAATRLTSRQAAAPRRYARILDAAYGAFKGVSRANMVIGGNTYTTGDIRPAMWLRYMRLPNGKPPRLDLYGHNPFSFRRPNLANPPSPQANVDFSDLGRLATLVDGNLRRRGSPRPRLFLSEFTIPTGPDQELNFYTDLSVQADWIRAAFAIARHWSRIYALGWIHLYDEPPGSRGGLLDERGGQKPGFAAFRAG